MTIPEPYTSTDLWPRVKASRVWPEVDETGLHDLGTAWLAALPTLVETPRADLEAFSRDLFAVWPDTAGLELRRELFGAIDTLDLVRAAVQSIANSLFFAVVKVEHLKTSLTRLIADNSIPYLEADADGRTKIVNDIVGDVDTTITIYSNDIYNR